MASTTTTAAAASAPNQYAYPKPSTLATRSLVTGDKPGETPSSSSPNTGAPEKPILLPRGASTNYADAVAASAGAAAPPTTTSTDAAARPGLDRQQSWTMQDKKREHSEKMLGGQMPGGGMGYSSTQK